MIQILEVLLLGGDSADARDPTKPISLRQRLREFIQRRPGERLNVIWRELGVNRGTAKYHLLMLERNRDLRILRSPSHSRYFPTSTQEADVPLLALLLRGRVLEVARLVLADPGIAQRDLTRALPISRKVFRAYANLLVSSQLIDEVRRPHTRQYFPTPRLIDVLAQLPQNPSTKPGSEVGKP